VKHRARHLHDDRLFDCYLTERGGDALDPPAAEHLADCDACGARYAELTAFMDTLRREAEADADAVFTPDLLRAQQQQIARRLEHVGRPARVISFPSRIVRRTIGASQSRTAPRWVAAAAAAGLFLGVALGASYEWNLRHAPTRAFGARDMSARIAPAASADDDAFLSDLELALERPHTRELQAFDALTPHVREIRDQR
jgi:anti-sigma factor RsiW